MKNNSVIKKEKERTISGIKRDECVTIRNAFNRNRQHSQNIEEGKLHFSTPVNDCFHIKHITLLYPSRYQGLTVSGVFFFSFSSRNSSIICSTVMARGKLRRRFPLPATRLHSSTRCFLIFKGTGIFTM